MNRRHRLLALITLTLLLITSFGTLGTLYRGQATAVSVLTNRYGNDRGGINLNETVLTTANVNSNTFGRLFTLAVDGNVYAQPLYVPGLMIGGVSHNVLFVATEHNSIYAFDADDPGGITLWHVNLGGIWNHNLYTGDIWGGEDGVMSTPVIDPNTNTLYAVSHHNGVTGAMPPKDQPYFDFHALDLMTGAEKFGGPVVITASVAGSGAGSAGGVVNLDADHQLSRPGLLLLHGKVFMAFGSTNDRDPYHGWVLSYDASTLQLANVFNDTPNGTEGGIWQAGSGLTSDGTHIFVSTGNGTFSADTGGLDYGDSIVSLSDTLSVTDWFAASNQCYLNLNDLDLGITGPLYMPVTNEIVGGGKQGFLYFLDGSSLGHYAVNPNRAGDTNCNIDSDPLDNSQIIQWFQAAADEMPTTPLYWNNFLYSWSANDYPKQRAFSTATKKVSPISPPVSLGAYKSGGGGGELVISANGSTPGSAILWGVHDNGSRGGILRAWDANNLTSELWDSQAKLGDSVGGVAKFNPVTVVNGRVFAASFSNRINVYGLYSSLPATLTTTPTSTSTVTPTATVTRTPLPTKTNTRTPSPSASPSATNTVTASRTATNTATPTSTATASASVTNTTTPSSTATATHTTTATATTSATPTNTSTSTVTPSGTITPTSTVSVTPTPTLTVTPNPTSAPFTETIGLYRPSTATFFLHFANVSGTPDRTIKFGGATDYPVVGDWLGTGITTIGVFNRSNGNFALRDSNTAGAPDHVFTMGNAGDLPMAGRWGATATHDGVGVFRPANGLIYLKNQLVTGFADSVMVLGNPGDLAIAGDWNGKGYDSPGVFRPNTKTFYLSNATSGTVFANYEVPFGLSTDLPLAGDWIGQGHDGIGVFRGTTSLFFLKNGIAAGNPDTTVVFGTAGDLPIAGHWTSAGPAPQSIVVPVTALPTTSIPPAPPTPTVNLPSFDG